MAGPYKSDIPAPPRPSHDRSPDTDSVHSTSPLRTPPLPTTYPPMPSQSSLSDRASRHVRLPSTDGNGPRPSPFPHYDPERAQTMPMPGRDGHFRPAGGKSGSWDMLAGIKKFEQSYEEFDTRNASEAHLAFAEGDMSTNKFTKFYNYLLNVSIVTRWILFIVPVMGIVWIPGILGFTKFPDATVWSVKLVWWSIWLSVVWGGWWVSLAASMISPRIARVTIGLVAVGARKYIDWFAVLHRYAAFAGWSLAIWITFNPLIDNNKRGDASDDTKKTLALILRLLFGLFLCAAVLFGEKFAIQWIAGKFHERSYAERIADQKFAVRVLTTLYRHSHDIPGRSDTLRDAHHEKRPSVDPKRFFKKALKGVRAAATTTTTALGTVASEIAGTSVLQPNSPLAKVQTALESANKSRLLARRLFYSFAKPGADYLIANDIARFFRSQDEADAAFAIFDKDLNGDITRDEFEMACLEFHREQLSIEHSMQDLDSAVGRLDNILMSVYFVVVILIFAVALEAQLVSLITGAGTLVLGLSWLIGSSLAEVLTSIIFLFIKHPYDVGDRVQVDKQQFTVKEIRLLSTVFLDSDSCLVQAPNTALNGLFIYNIRRSPQMSESFAFDVAYSTAFEQLEHLRDLMLEFLKSERRDFQPAFDVSVVDIPEQTKMSLKVDIKYKSNWQQGALKAKRRNKWICALKVNMAKAKIYGPDGNPDAEAAPKEITVVPWEEVQQEKQRHQASPPPMPSISTMPSLQNVNSVMLDDSQDVFGERDELNMTNPRRQDTSGLRQRPPVVPMPSAATMPHPIRSVEEFEMQPARQGPYAPQP